MPSSQRQIETPGEAGVTIRYCSSWRAPGRAFPRASASMWEISPCKDLRTYCFVGKAEKSAQCPWRRMHLLLLTHFLKSAEPLLSRRLLFS
jgi:hypothetical protein